MERNILQEQNNCPVSKKTSLLSFLGLLLVSYTILHIDPDAVCAGFAYC